MRKIGLLVVCLLSCVAVWAQSLEIKKEFTKEPYASVLSKYANEFREHEMPDMPTGQQFPYAVVCVNLQGNGGDVAAAKRFLSLDLGAFPVQERVTDLENMVLFLVPSSVARVSLTCGDGCSKVRILDLPCLESNAVYSGTVHFVPYKEEPIAVKAPERQFFKFRVKPAHAVVTVWENGKEQILPMKEGGTVSKMFDHGTYKYRISANRYHSEEGTFTVSDSQREMTVALRPQFGYLSVNGNDAVQGAYVFATNKKTGDMIQLGTIPLSNKELDAGTYTLRVQQAKYKDYSTTIAIEEDKTTAITPVLEANFAQVTLTAQSGADILWDGTRLGTSSYSGTLELGEYVIETRQASHKSAYTRVSVTAQTSNQTIALNNPTPIYGTLVVDGSPEDAAVYIDGKKEGMSPLVINKLLIGEHKVRLEKEGYAKQEKTVQIAEGQEHMMDYTLAKETPKAAPQPAATSASTGGHEYVDLGLSVKWATCNVGASRPEDYGDYFAWGETKPKTTYNWSTYKWCKGSEKSQTKYCTSSSYGTMDNKTVLEAADDAARANWGGSWRMPTKAEQDELRKKCEWTWTTQNGVKGYKVTSKSNGNSIFLPAAGYRGDSSLGNAGSYGFFWSSSLYTGSPSYAFTLNFNSSDVDWYDYYRYYGLSVRPVCP